MSPAAHALSDPAPLHPAWRIFIRCGLLFTLLGVALLAPPLRAQTDSVTREYQLKAAFLYNFTKFVEWPAHRFPDATSPITIAVLGENPFGDELENAVQGRLVRGRPIQVKVIATLAEAGNAEVLFVSASNEFRLGHDPAMLLLNGTLTVGESPRFSLLGGIITFTLETDKVRFEVNQRAGEQAGLKINAQLLKLATAVR